MLPISVLIVRPAQRGAALQRAVPASVTRGTLSRPGLDLLDPCGARGDGIATRGPSAIQRFAEATCDTHVTKASPGAKWCDDVVTV